MLIENPESLKTWLTSYLEPLCDADPQALAKYVMALIKKDKPAKDLKNILFEQLEVFLQKETVPFVEVLFETLDNKSYLDTIINNSKSNSSSGSPDRALCADVGADTLHSPVDQFTSAHGTILSSSTVNSPFNEYEPHKSSSSSSHLPDLSGSNSSLANQLIASQSKRSYHNRDRSRSRSNSRSKSRSRSRSRSPPVSSPANRHRDIDMRRPGGYVVMSNQSGPRSHYIDRQQRRAAWNGPSSRGSGRRYITHVSGGYRKNQQQHLSNRRSRSRSRSKSHSRSRSRSRSYSYSPKSNRSRSRSHDRTRSRSRNRAQSRSRSRSRDKEGLIVKKLQVSSKSPVENPMGEDDRDDKPMMLKKRCRDYDEKGYCMRGDLCQYDHGSDPVVLDGAVSSVVACLAANGAGSLVPSTNVTAATVSVAPPNFLEEPYNPEAPGIDKQINPHASRRAQSGSTLVAPLRGPIQAHLSHHHPLWAPFAPSLRPIPPGATSSFIPSMGQQTNRPRELVGVPTLPDGKTVISNSEPNIPHKNTIVETSMQHQTNSVHHTNSHQNNQSKRGGRGGHNRGGYRGGYLKRMVTNENAEKCTLEVRKIPPNLNTITNLNSHFSKFGSIVNIQVCYDSDPEAALVQFASHSEALAAHRCTEAVLNNRFIKVFWHSKDSSQSQQQPHSNRGSGQSNDSSLRDNGRGGSANGSIENKNFDNSNSRLSVKERLGFRNSSDNDKTNTTTNVTPSGSIQRTVFNPLLLKKQYPSSTPSTSTASILISTAPAVSTANQSANSQQLGVTQTGASSLPVKSKEDFKKNKLLKKLELQKKRQQILVSYMGQQKLLIDKLEKAKSDKEKSDIRSTVETLNKQIKSLEEQIKKDAEVILAEASKLPSGKKSKIQIEKELLDVEMDFYNKLHKGETTAELIKKLQELKLKAKSLIMTDVRSAKAMMKRLTDMKGALRGRNRLAKHTMGRTFENLRKVDRRTRKILIEGLREEDHNDFVVHLSQTAEIENINSIAQGALVTFKTRRGAEMALPLISNLKLKDQVVLRSTWFEEAKVKVEEPETPEPTVDPLAGVKVKVEVKEEKTEEPMNVDQQTSVPITKEEPTISTEKETKEEEIDEKIDTEEIRQEEEDDEDTEIDEGAGEDDDEEDSTDGSPEAELLLGVNVEDDLLEEEETDDEDENRAWRR